jgi:hypothetical protein
MADDRLLKSSPADDRLLVSSPFSGLKSGKVSQELALAGASGCSPPLESALRLHRTATSGFGGRRSDCMHCVNCAGDGCPSARDFFRSRAETGVRSTDELPLRGVAGFADSEVASSAVGEGVDESTMLRPAALAAFASALSRVRAEAARERDESALRGAAGFSESEVASSAIGEVVDESSMLLAALAAFAAALSRVRVEAARATDASALLGPLVPFVVTASDVSASACADCRQPIAALRGRRAGVGLPHSRPSFHGYKHTPENTSNCKRCSSGLPTLVSFLGCGVFVDRFLE